MKCTFYVDLFRCVFKHKYRALVGSVFMTPKGLLLLELVFYLLYFIPVLVNGCVEAT